MKTGVLRKYSATLAWVMRVLDILLILTSGYAVYRFKFGDWEITAMYLWLCIALAITTFIALHIAGAYQPLRGRRFYRVARRVWLAISGAFLALLTAFFLLKVSAHFSREWLLTHYVVTCLVLILERLVLFKLLGWLRRHDFNLRRIVIVGAGELGQSVAQKIQQTDWSGYKVIAFWDNAPQALLQADIPISAIPDNIEAYIQAEGVDEIWLALSLGEAHTIKQLVEALAYTPATIRLVPDLFGMRLVNHSVSEIGGVYTVNVRETPITGWNYVLKELEDKLLAGVILIIISPIMLALAIAIKMSSPGPVFYRQERVSWNNKRFNMLKFRSMPVNVEAKTGAVWAKSGEQRATRIGAFMRKTSLDELPQFINVLKGDMSIVGPRPERPVFVEQFKKDIPGYMQKHMMKAGITGWAQVNGWRGDTDLAKRIEYDLYYIENWSVWLDVRIIFLTLFKGFVHRNAY